MNIEVTSVSKKSQPLSSTAASVFVITAEDIRRSGITILPELLRLAPGVQVARLSSGSWAVGIRGFNDEYSNKLLVLVDGRSVYNVFYTGVFWDTLNVSVEDIERIEVIRGPGAAMWGTNAVNGVVNIITKSSKSSHGLDRSAAASDRKRPRRRTCATEERSRRAPTTGSERKTPKLIRSSSWTVSLLREAGRTAAAICARTGISRRRIR